jgi:chaperone modulatory protein CbpM
MAQNIVLSGQLLDEEYKVTLSGLCETCSVHAEIIIDMVEEGVLEPRGDAPQQWRFIGQDIVRVKTALRLQQDLGLNLAGVALALELKEELANLHARIDALEHMLAEDDT